MLKYRCFRDQGCDAQMQGSDAGPIRPARYIIGPIIPKTEELSKFVCAVSESGFRLSFVVMIHVPHCACMHAWELGPWYPMGRIGVGGEDAASTWHDVAHTAAALADAAAVVIDIPACTRVLMMDGVTTSRICRRISCCLLFATTGIGTTRLYLV